MTGPRTPCDADTAYRLVALERLTRKRHREATEVEGTGHHTPLLRDGRRPLTDVYGGLNREQGGQYITNIPGAE